MDLPRDMEDSNKKTTNHSSGTPITMDALEKKLFAAQGSQLRLYEQYMSSVSRLKEKDQVTSLVRYEASNNAQALKEFVEENHALRGECDDLVNQCKDLERKCFVYHLDLEASKRYGNGVKDRARDAERGVQELEKELRQVYSVIKKHESLVDSVLATMVSEDETKLSRWDQLKQSFVSEDETKLSRWDQLKQSVRKIVKEKELLILKLDRAEQEVEIVRDQNKELKKEKRKQHRRSAPKKRKEKEA